MKIESFYKWLQFTVVLHLLRPILYNPQGIWILNENHQKFQFLKKILTVEINSVPNNEIKSTLKSLWFFSCCPETHFSYGPHYLSRNCDLSFFSSIGREQNITIEFDSSCSHCHWHLCILYTKKNHLSLSLTLLGLHHEFLFHSAFHFVKKPGGNHMFSFDSLKIIPSFFSGIWW